MRPFCCDDEVVRFVRLLRTFPIDTKLVVLGKLGAMLLKPRVVRKGKRWIVIDVGSVESKPLSSWSAAVQYAKEWHRNKYGYLGASLEAFEG